MFSPSLQIVYKRFRLSLLNYFWTNVAGARIHFYGSGSNSLQGFLQSKLNLIIQTVFQSIIKLVQPEPETIYKIN